MPALVLKQGLDLELGLDLCLGLDLEMLTEPEPMPTDAEHLRSTDYLKRWSQLWACEEPVAVVGAQIIPSSSRSVI